MFLLSPKERACLQQRLHDKAKEIGQAVDPRHEESDAHLIFESLHVLADGIPERLYAILHPASPNGLRQTRDWEADPGRTMLAIRAVAQKGARALE